MVMHKKGIPSPGPCQCHPKVGTERPAEGCIPREILEEIANSVKVSKGAKLRSRLEKHFGVKPDEEYSFLMKLPIQIQKKAVGYLRPPMPPEWKNDPDKWLDSNNISAVMNQYEEAYPKFEFMGPFPIDFASPDPYQKGGKQKCLMNEVCELRVKDAYKNGTESIGIIYNLDPHYKGGSHWVATYIDIKNSKCFYFDSYGMAPPPQIATFMKWLTHTEQDPNMTLTYNSKRIQYKNTECGMYSMYFIIRMLMGDEIVNLTRATPKDDRMMEIRHCLFST